MSRPSDDRGPQGVAPPRRAAPRHGGADRRRPCGAGRLLPVLGALGRGRAPAGRDACPAEDALGLRAAVALALGLQQAGRDHGALHGRAGANPVVARPHRNAWAETHRPRSPKSGASSSRPRHSPARRSGTGNLPKMPMGPGTRRRLRGSPGPEHTERGLRRGAPEPPSAPSSGRETINPLPWNGFRANSKRWFAVCMEAPPARRHRLLSRLDPPAGPLWARDRRAAGRDRALRGGRGPHPHRRACRDRDREGRAMRSPRRPELRNALAAARTARCAVVVAKSTASRATSPSSPG